MRSTQHSDQARSTLAGVEGLGIRRGGKWLIRHIDFAIERGEIVTLIGPNGGGKSTIAKALLGIIRCDEGRVVRAPGLKIGYVPQRLGIDWSMPLTVRCLMKLSAEAGVDEIHTVLADVGLSAFLDAPVQGLSGGEFQRLLLARALLRHPDLLVLDEPVQGVDYTGQMELYDLIGEVRKRLGCGVLLVSHDLHIVMAQTDRVLCINRHICCSGSGEKVAAHPAFQQLFGTHGAETLALYQHTHDHYHDLTGAVVCPTPDARSKQSQLSDAGDDDGHDA